MSAEAEKGDVAVQESGKRELELAGEAGKPDEVNEENTSAKKAKSEGTGQTNGILPHSELKALGVRQYLEKTVVPVLLQGMQELVKNRPEDPFESLAKYLIENNPQKGK